MVVKSPKVALANSHPRLFFVQKPGNVFIDQEGNIRLGDFGLATRHRAKDDLDADLSETQGDTGHYDTIEDISRLLGGSAHYTASISHQSSVQESMTGGVGTTFYRAPEQEGGALKMAGKKNDSSYDSKADLFSLGIMLFEMFHPPFETVRVLSYLYAKAFVLPVVRINTSILAYIVHGKSRNPHEASR